MLIRFLIYGMAGWIMEILWTGIHSFWEKDRSLMGYTSLWMFPIYGMAVLLEPICLVMKGLPLMVRGGVYMLCIFSAEYLSGWGLQRVVGLCPWNYSDSHFQINGLIRLDYAPLWFGVGLLFEGLFFRLV